MSDERELQRHNNILEQIKNANNRDDLPNITFATIASYLASNVYFEKRKISQTAFKPVIDELLNYGRMTHENVKEAFIKVITDNYPDVEQEKIIEKYNEILKSPRVNYILSEISQKNLKLDEIIKKENLEIHKTIIKEIKFAHEIKDLPKVGLTELNKKLIRAVNDNDFNRNIKISEVRELTEAYLNNASYKEVEIIVEKICSTQELTDEEKKLMSEQILGSIILDETIEYVVEEIKLKEARKLEIYKQDHEDIMQAIKDANRISQLPQNLTVSILTSYLNGNTTIYSNDDRIKNEDLKELTKLLLDGYKWEDNVIKKEIKKIVSEIYRDKTDAFDLLYKKLSSLPKTYYYVEEINSSLTRQNEFIGKSFSNVNVYFIPNDKSPIDGGRFYNCYINRVDNLELDKLIPLNLDEIVPEGMDIDSIEWYIQEYYDETFKTAGGIILNRDETIGNVNVFKPNDGKVGISLEEKSKMDELSDLDRMIEEKQSKLQKIDEELEDKEQKTQRIELKIKDIVRSYEEKALQLQMEMLKSIEKLKSDIYLEDYTEQEQEKPGKGGRK